MQIRTHAQKYFKTIAKAQKNGEEGEVFMEGISGAAGLVPPAGHLRGVPTAAAAAASYFANKQGCRCKKKLLEEIL